MKLVVAEKNDAAQKIAELLSSKKPQKDKVYSTPIFRFERNGEDWVTIGLKGHILEPDFVPNLVYRKSSGWWGITADGLRVKADLPSGIEKPPFKKRKPFTEDGVDLKVWKMQALPYLVYAPVEKLPKAKDIIRALKNLAGKADSIVIATDFDREGELIGSDALQCIREVNDVASVSRARYSAFTKEEINQAFDNLVDMDDDLAAAGGSRRDIDLIWGAVLTRYLTLVKFAGVGNVRSSGRVQTPTLALIVEREKERTAFVPEDYWVIKGAFGEEPDDFEAPHTAGHITEKEKADAIMARLEGQTQARVASIDKKRRTQPAPVPFNTTSLMAAAASEGLSPARTMRIAESLYMRGLISYPRVDNTVYPASLNLEETVKKIAENPLYASYCSKLLSKGKLKATRGKKETTDHPPIYPTAPASSDTLAAADWKLYNLIARRFLATLSDPAIIEGTKIGLDVAGEMFEAKGDVLVSPGFREIYPYGSKKDEELPALEEGQFIAFRGATCTQKQTEPRPRYSQGKLIQEMERLGLGTKSTRHSIIERLYEVKYIQNDPIEPSQLGMAVIEALDKFAPRITHPEMTAELEAEMDAIVAGKTTKDDVVKDSRDRLLLELLSLLPHQAEIKEALSDAVTADAFIGMCPKCGKNLLLRSSAKTKSMFIGCAGWPECDATYPVPSNAKIEPVDEPCPSCGMPQVKVSRFRAKPQTQCIDPYCETNFEPDLEVGLCPVCKEKGAEHVMIARKNPRTLKRSIRCENYDECGTGYPLPANGKLTKTDEACEHCGAPMVIVATSRSPWKLCPNPKCPGKEEKAVKKATRKKTSKKSARSKSSKTEETAE